MTPARRSSPRRACWAAASPASPRSARREFAGAASRKGDIAILNYALTLEYLEAAFYTEAERKGALRGELASFAIVVGGHERAHVKGLKAALGHKAVKKPMFDFQGTTEDAAKFAATAQALEDTGVSAYARRDRA